MEWILRALTWLLLATSAAGQSQCLSLTSQFPDCVAGCITTGASSIGCTNTLDLSCQCKPGSSAAIQAYAAGCATAACRGDAAAILDGLAAGSSVCSCVTSAVLEALQVAPVTESYEAGATDDPRVGCGVCDDDGGRLPPAPPPMPYTPPFPNTWSPWSSNTHSSHTYNSADAVSPSGDDQDVSWCEKTTVVTVVQTRATVSSWLSPAWTPSPPYSSSTWSYVESPFEPEDGSSAYGARTPPDHSAETKPLASEDNKILVRDTTQARQPHYAPSSCVQDVALVAENCTSLAEEVMPTCAQDCYLSMAPDVGCEDLDFSCQCNEETQAKLSTMMMPCVLSACSFADLPSVIAAGSSVCSCASATGVGQALEQQKEARAPAPTQAPEQAAPGSEPEKMGAPTTTICEEVSVRAEDCAIHRPTFAPCGTDCLSPVIPQVDCGIDDFHCQCAPDKQAALSALVRPCVEESCQGGPPPINWDAGAACACASGGRTSTCYETTVTGWTTSSSTSTRTTSADDEEETAGLQGAAGRYGVGIIIGIATVVFAAAIAL